MLAGLLMLLRTDEEREQFAQFYRQYENLMFKTARQILDSQEDCEDVVQTSCAYLIDHFDKFTSYDARQVASYLVLLIRNRAKDMRDRQKKTSYEDIEQYAEIMSEQAKKQVNPILEAAFAQLPERYREALTLRYYNELSIKDIAGLLQISEDAAKKLLQRSRDALRNLMVMEGGAES
jgi:RNA polymerase sigma-70 factor (ECF subfamily)